MFLREKYLQIYMSTAYQQKSSQSQNDNLECTVHGKHIGLHIYVKLPQMLGFTFNNLIIHK